MCLVGADRDRTVLEDRRRKAATRERLRGAATIGDADEERGNHGLRTRWQCDIAEPLADLLSRADNDRRGSGFDEPSFRDTARPGTEQTRVAGSCSFRFLDDHAQRTNPERAERVRLILLAPYEVRGEMLA